MKRQFACLLCLVTAFMALLCPLRAKGATALDPAAEASLTLEYQKEGEAFSDVPVRIFRVAEAFAALHGRGMEPKRIRLVRGRGAPYLALIEAKKGAKPGLIWEETIENCE